jgi:enoyl-CoA hydratase/carnithine racemase
MGGYVRFEVDDGVGVIRLDRPPANAIDETLGLELQSAIREAGGREDVGAVVVWGGAKLFAAGADIKTMATFGPAEALPFVSALGDACDQLEALPKISIAAINGWALGGGCELALAADLRYAAEDAKLGQPEVRIGVFPGAGGTQRLPRLIGLGRAKMLVFGGEHVGAPEALAMGLVDRVVAADDVLRVAVDDARRFARGPREALAAAKAAFLAAVESPGAAGLAFERQRFVELFGSQDQREGMAAFVEKREPRFGARPD